MLRDGKLVRRFSQRDLGSLGNPQNDDLIRTKLHLEVGWGARHKSHDWLIEFGISDGAILAVELRFRGMEVVAPTEATDVDGYFHSRVLEKRTLSVVFQTRTTGNPNNSTPAMQGICLQVEVPRSAVVQADLDGILVRWPILALIQGARTGQLGNIDSPAWRFHRAPLQDIIAWMLAKTYVLIEFDGSDVFILSSRTIVEARAKSVEDNANNELDVTLN